MKQLRKLTIDPELEEDFDLIEAKEAIEKLYNNKVDELLFDCAGYEETAPYGDTYCISGYSYSDYDIKRCQEEAKLEIRAEFVANPIGFINDYIGCEELFPPREVSKIINNL